jgi:DNA-binding response OmpR family regulator
MSTSILVVEPSRTIRTLLDIYFQRDGHQVTVFASYAEAQYALSLPQFKRFSPAAIFLALHVSHPESYRLLEDLRWRYAHTFTRIVVMVVQEERDHHKVRSLAQDEHLVLLLKPFRVQDMLALVAAPAALSSSMVETR